MALRYYEQLKRFLSDHRRWLLAIALGIGLYIHQANLTGVIYLDTDEIRPFVLSSSGPLIYAMCHPIYVLFGYSQEAVFRFAGLLAFLTIIGYYRLLRMCFDRPTALVCTALYALFPLRLNYARMLVPAVFIEFYFIISTYLLFKAFKKRSRLYAGISGALCGAMLFVHAQSYVIVLMIILSPGLVLLLERTYPKGELAHLWRYLGYGFLLAVFGLQCVFYYCGPGLNLLGSLVSLYSVTNHLVPITRSWVLNAPTAPIAASSAFKMYLLLFFRQVISVDSGRLFVFGVLDPGLIRFVIAGTCVALVFMPRHLLREKKYRAVILYSIFIGGGVIFHAAAYLKIHTLFERHTVWFVGGYSMALGFWFVRLFRGRIIPAKILAAAYFIFLCLFFIYVDWHIIDETFNFNTVSQYFQKKGIPKSQVLTSWWQLNKPNDPPNETTSLIPGGLGSAETGYFAAANKAELPELWFMKPSQFGISWRHVFEGYRAGRCRYLMTSGIGSMAALGRLEPMLLGVQQTKKWPNPRYFHRHRPYWSHASDCFIYLYDLKRVFTDLNLEVARSLRKRIADVGGAE